MEPDTKVTLNIGGQRFVTWMSTLSRIQGTRLSGLSPQDPSYDTDTQEYYFDHNPHLFNYVLDACRYGEVHFPKCVCAPTVLTELTFWGLDEGRISACCWKACSDWEEQQNTLDIIDRAYGGQDDVVEGEKGAWRRRMNTVWLFLDDPYSSKVAKVWSFFFLALLVVSTLVISLETVESLRVPINHLEYLGVNRDNLVNKNQSINQSNHKVGCILAASWNTSNPKIDKYYNSDEHPMLRYTNRVCSVFFFVELVIRFLTCPGKLNFFFSFFNVIDVLAIFPIFILTLINVLQPCFWVTHNLEVSYNVVGLVAVLRAVRVLKIVKHSRGLQVIFLAIRASLNEMLLLGLLVAIGMLIFSTAIYYAELYQPHSFESIPVGFWWSIITITTVGYGDVTPVTAWGQVIAALCAVCGILMTGLPIPVIANNFRLFYTYASLKTKLDQRGKNNAIKQA